eukprot:TRINITY_DN6458_c0_g1_i1.p1 TRINITY_DN6458_c0_g1~~TRINITY_DN6458_c0_g1_i1.p1  ORF type:complete len:509 (+),score=188.61 TRINITY_DN6458_c0_g1_i1:28-1554(+)
MKNIFIKNKNVFKSFQLKRTYCYWSYEEFKRPPDTISWGNLLYHKAKKPLYHSKPQYYDYEDTVMGVSILPHGDNLYSYLVIDKKEKLAVVIDAGEPDMIIKEAKKRNVKVAAVLCTDNLPDFTRGVNKIRDSIAADTFTTMVRRTSGVVMASDQTQLKIGGLRIRMIPCILGMPTGSSMFYVEVDNPKDRYHNPPKPRSAFFSGKFLTSNGLLQFSRKSSEHVGKVIQNEIFTLDFSCQVFPAVEEALKNICFLGRSQIRKKEIKKKIVEVFSKRKRNLPCVPFDLEDEIETNPFLGIMRHDLYHFLRTRVEPYPVSYLLSKLSSEREEFSVDFKQEKYERMFAKEMEHEGRIVVEATPTLDPSLSEKNEKENYFSIIRHKTYSDYYLPREAKKFQNNNDRKPKRKPFNKDNRGGGGGKHFRENRGGGRDNNNNRENNRDNNRGNREEDDEDDQVDNVPELDEHQLLQLKKFRYLTLQKRIELYNQTLKDSGLDSVARDWLLESPSK